MMPMLLLLGAIAALPAHGGTIRNTDNKEYVFVVHWEDLSTPEKYEISPGKAGVSTISGRPLNCWGKRTIFMCAPRMPS